MLEQVLLITGLIFPVVSLLTLVASRMTKWLTGRYSSAVLIPLVGPVLLTCWVIVAGASSWLIPLVWLLDLGTVYFFIVLPRLTIDWWRTSAFTRLMTLRGTNGIENSVLTLHRGGHYLLMKYWNRNQSEAGILELAETGTFYEDGDVFALRSHFGMIRKLQRIDSTTFDVVESVDDPEEWRSHSLLGWRLKCPTALQNTGVK